MPVAKCLLTYKNKTMEQQVSETILQQRQSVKIGETTYRVAPPSFATLILFSSFVSQLPKEELSTQTPIASLLSQGEKLENICKAMASVILGAKEFHKEINYSQEAKKSFWCIFSKKKTTKNTQTKGEFLTEKILHLDISEVSKIFIELLNLMKLHDFFQLTTSLIEMNIVKPTKAEVVN